MVADENSAMHETINETLVRVFNQILRIEENRLKTFGSDLSVKEAHVIEAAAHPGGDNTLSAMAARLGVTAGSMTVAVNTLEKKGYLARVKSSEDRRRIHIILTPKAEKVNQLHQDFHREMTRAVANVLPEDQLKVLVRALEAVNAYFLNEKGS